MTSGEKTPPSAARGTDDPGDRVELVAQPRGHDVAHGARANGGGDFLAAGLLIYTVRM
jgi:hypothetical protein